MMVSSTQRDGVTAMASTVQLDVRSDVSMAPHTTYKVGGKAALFVEVHTPDILPALLERLASLEIDWLILGNGSNVLFADAGFDGAVLHLGDGFAASHVERDALGRGVHRLEAGAGTSITKLLRVAKEQELAGVEFLGGVPGTIGGAVRMNAGTVMGEVRDSLEAAAVAVAGEAIRWLSADQLGLAYRHSELPEGSVVTAARFRCGDADPAMRTRLAEVLAYRKATQPLTQPSCGSVFANPPGDHAGRLIEACGLKGHRIGGAAVSEVHANWIVNTGGATAGDVRSVITHCIRRVEEQFGLTLRHEVQLLGDWEVSA
jgi:UDP-N-acetylmuramate dehydrogenase